MSSERRARIWRWVAIVLLVALCGTGMNSARDAWPSATTSGQYAQSIAQVVYSAAGLLAALALAARWPIARRIFAIFAVAVTFAAGLAPVVWGGTAWWTGAVAAVAGAAIAWLIWLAFARGDHHTAPHATAGVPMQLDAGALLFDLDGVLVDSTANVERHWRDWATSNDLDPARILSVVHGRRAIDTIREQAPQLDAERELATLVDAEMRDTSGILVFDGAADLLASIPRGHWAIVTSGTQSVASARLRATGLPIPDVLITADRVEQGKPDPEGYLAAAEALGIAPAECIVVEDAPAGVEAARRAGMRCVAITSTHETNELEAATAVVRVLRDITVGEAAAGGLRVIVGEGDPRR